MSIFDRNNGRAKQQPPFVSGANVPILGQPAKLLAFVPNYLLQCNCDGKHPLLSVGQGAKVRCPGCHKTFMVASVQHNAQTGELHAVIAQVLTEEEAAALQPAGSTTS